MLRPTVLAPLAAAALSVLSLAQAPIDGSLVDRGARPLGLKHARFDPLRGLPEVPAALGARADCRLHVVQFHTATDLQARDAVEDLAGAAVSFLPPDAWLVRCDARAANALRALPGVRWVGAYQPAWRLQTTLLQALRSEPAARLETARYNLVVADKRNDKPELITTIEALGGQVTHPQEGSLILEVELTHEQLVEVAHLDQVLWIDAVTPIETDMDNVRVQGGANYVEGAGGYSGQGINGHVYEGLNTSVADFNVTPTPVLSNNVSSSHGHSTATIQFGNGAANPAARGMAPDARCFFTNYSAIQGNASRWQVIQALVNTHEGMHTTASWGNSRNYDYDSVTADCDDIVFDHDIPWTQSQSNSGSTPSRPQAWAKNLFSIGGVRHGNNSDRFDDTWSASGSTGPAPDGRIKPDLSAFYDSILTASESGGTTNFGGTSGATPIVAGHNLLAIQMFTDGLFGAVRNPGGSRFSNRPHAATLKALQIAHATPYAFDGAAPNGPDSDNARNHVGWGFPDLRTLYDNRARVLVVDETDVLGQGGSQSYPVTVLAGDPELKVTLAWTDPAANPAAVQALINDLDLLVTAPDGTVYRGNHGLDVGNHSVPGGAADTVNNVECVFVGDPMPGNWMVQVTARLVAQDGHVQTPQNDVDYGLCATFGAQRARVERIGDGCAGSQSTGACYGVNGFGGSLITSGGGTNVYAYDWRAPETVTITGAEIFTRSRSGNASVSLEIRMDVGDGQPAASAVRSGNVTIGTTTGFHRATFAPLTIPAGTRVWVVHSASGVYPAGLDDGEIAPAFYLSGNTWARSGRVYRSSFRIVCSQGSLPVAAEQWFSGRPSVGRSYTTELRDALASSPAFRITGVSRELLNGAIPLPFALDGVGAPGCALRVSSEVVDGFAVNGFGRGALPTPVPNVASLLGVTVYQQCLVLDAAANALGATTSSAHGFTLGR